uniref:Helicase n=1 Tax=viral metagenome TaxID=1070528 RepID=A0A6C0D3L3_9ZZZZ
MFYISIIGKTIMVVICSAPYPNNSNYESYFELYPYPLSDFQKYAIEAIVEGQHTLVTAPTGSGKTLPAEFAIQHFVGQGKKVIYTSPIKALSNQKYYEFTRKFPHISFGLFTGDIKTNPEADVLIMTTEILMNSLFLLGSGSGLGPVSSSGGVASANLSFQIDLNRDLAAVVFDEVHYINDTERGNVWEKSILMLPKHVQMVMLSATIDNPAGFAEWCESSGEKKVYLATTSHRIVPLSHYGFLCTNEAVFKTIRDKTVQQQIRDSTNKLISLQDAKGSFSEQGYRTIAKMTDMFDKHQLRQNRKHVLNKLCEHLLEKDMLPAITFVFSRKQVELCAESITVSLLEFDSKVGYTVRYECEQIIRKLPNFREYLLLPEYNQLVSLLEKGIGIHHSGMIPILREIVELMISKKYIKMLFATESFAIGLDCPIRTAVFTSLSKFDGQTERYVLAHEYSQMSGRAGRRGIDTVGHVVHCNNLFSVPTLTDYRAILSGKPQTLVSKYHVSYNVVLNLLKAEGTHTLADLSTFSKKSMIRGELEKELQGRRFEIQNTEKAIEDKKRYLMLLRCPRDICDRYIDIEDNIKYMVNRKRKDAEQELRKIKDENRTVLDDVKSVREFYALEKSLDSLHKSVSYYEKYIDKQTETICQILIDGGYMFQVDESYILSPMGKMAASIAEIHPLILSKLMVTRWDSFADFTPKLLVGLFACFTDVKVPEDERSSRPQSDSDFLNYRLTEVVEMANDYQLIENEFQVDTGIHYDNILQFDLADLAMKWYDLEDEFTCKIFIRDELSAKSISVGDFNKAMLKIVTITKEFIGVAETLGDVGLLHKLGQIEGNLLKYVATSQSLYV